MRARVTHSIDDLARDCGRIPPEMYRKGKRIVSEGARVGASLARDNAKAKSGIHGERYYKRITADAARAATGFGAGAISAEFGPTGFPRSDFVGAGYRNGPGNTDLARAADVVGPALHGEVRAMLDELFWPGAS